jgi:hypothetical protein
MLLTIALILTAMIAVAALELWLFWHLGERDERRRIRMRAEIDAADAKERRVDTRSREERHYTTGASARLRGPSTSSGATRRGSQRLDPAQPARTGATGSGGPSAPRSPIRSGTDGARIKQDSGPRWPGSEHRSGASGQQDERRERGRRHASPRPGRKPDGGSSGLSGLPATSTPVAHVGHGQVAVGIGTSGSMS